MSAPSRETVLDALRAVVGGDDGRDIVTAGMITGLSVADGAVRFAIEVDPARGAALEPLRQAAEAAVKAVPGVTDVIAALTAHSDAPSAPATAKGAPPDLGTRAKPGDKPLRPPPPAPNGGKVDGVERIIAVGSGKGGVGKSTVSANLAVALAMEGWRVGLLDADVYGPSQPRMLGIEGRPASPDGKTIVPLRGYGVKCMSMGFLTGESESVIWRGPMLMSAVTQMLYQVAWAPLDFLIIDLPPGTGDVQLTLSQKTKLTGAVVVSTPQDVALLDARKAIDMFAKIDIPILGVIENMATFCCPNCGHETQIFGHGGAEAEAVKIGAPFLGRVPLALEVRTTSDEGTPIVASKPDSAEAERFRDMARALAEGVGAHAPNAAYPV
ncbi:Mrp/NBP35 family ATP-binding protein [Pikeienuella piscinae]|uniref:Iron-sulfur cluster carrier protein n=1 Tax=Pikeienuella piscinae TaxID=2748098 RepID=A0A7L5C0Q5_9RHOB|nr:Mrp/NBP35 family ATP-binding protein [Pikeienuella piscinae]QIE56347.1 Mrp/NBP35 family ATP-binding protein [Pikeienuella piscinae]